MLIINIILDTIKRFSILNYLLYLDNFELFKNFFLIYVNFRILNLSFETDSFGFSHYLILQHKVD